MVRWLIFCFLVASVSLTLLGLVVDLAYQLEYSPKIAELRGEQEAKLEPYLQEKAFLVAHPLFTQSKKEGNDFNQYLLAAVLKNQGTAIVDSPSRKKVLSAGKTWLNKRHYVETNPRIDDLFAQIYQYSYWKLTDALAKEDIVSPIELVVAGQIFLANGFHNAPQEITNSLNSTRKLSSLLLTTDLLNFKLAGLSLLEKEHHVVNEMNGKKKAEFISWELIPLTEIKRFRMFLQNTSLYLSFITTPEILTKVFLDAEFPPGFCAVFNKKQVLLKWAELFLQSSFPFEPSFSPNVASIDKIKTQVVQTCAGPFEKLTEPRPFVSRIPYLRRIRAVDFLLKSSHQL